MAMETVSNTPKVEITDAWVLDNLKKRLEEIELSLVNAQKVEDVVTEGEDDVELREARSEQDEMRDVLLTEKKLIEAKIGWVTNRGDACVAPDCKNKVSEGRRRNLGVTCPVHMNDEGILIRDLPFR